MHPMISSLDLKPHNVLVEAITASHPLFNITSSHAISAPLSFLPITLPPVRYIAKIADFGTSLYCLEEDSEGGIAGNLEGKRKEPKVLTNACGTEGYTAPEIYK